MESLGEVINILVSLVVNLNLKKITGIEDVRFFFIYFILFFIFNIF